MSVHKKEATEKLSIPNEKPVFTIICLMVF